MLSDGESAPTLMQISEMVGNSSDSPIKIELDTNQLHKVHQKVENWKQKNSESLTVVELKKLNSAINQTKLIGELVF